eukprot:767217-Hanusia_phi.AAC.1
MQAASAIKEALEAADDAKSRLNKLRNSSSSWTSDPAKKLTFTQLGEPAQRGRGGRRGGEPGGEEDARWEEQLRSESSEAVQEARRAFKDAVQAGEEVIVSWIQFCSQLREVDFCPSKETQQRDYLGRRASSATKRRKEELASKTMNSLLGINPSSTPLPLPPPPPPFPPALAFSSLHSYAPLLSVPPLLFFLLSSPLLPLLLLLTSPSPFCCCPSFSS